MSQFFIGASSSAFVNKAPVTHPLSYPYQVESTDFYIIVDSSQSRAINLPFFPAIGNRFVIKDGDGESNANPITIDGSGNTIDSFSTYTIQSSYGFVGVLFDGTEWKVINQ